MFIGIVRFVNVKRRLSVCFCVFSIEFASTFVISNQINEQLFINQLKHKNHENFRQ